MKFEPEKDTRRILVIVAASVIMALNIKTFVRTGDLFPGGATGLTLLFQRAARMFFHVEIPYTVLNVAINAVPVYIGFRYIGKKFTLFSGLSILLTSVLTDLMPAYVITYDTLLISVFGGMINGLVISMCLAANATTGGTDFIAIYLSEKKGVDSFNIVLGINAVILVSAGILFGWDKALYSIIFQYVSTQVLHILYKKYQQQTLLVVTNHAKNVSEMAYSACKAINANADLALVGGLYHDIGKAEHPEYFIENQSGKNAHDEINNTLSAAIIKSHVKLGVEKAKEAGLPQEVIDIISEHHGNDLIKYFYNEAVREAKERSLVVSEEDFRYNGRIPSTPESAVVMLADCSEAATRTLKNPNHQKYEKLISSIIMDKMNYKQLNNSRLTLNDLDKIKESFIHYLMGRDHQRIEYGKEN